MRSRSVLCIKDDQIVGDSLCLDSNNVDSTTKPITLEKCEIKAVSYCKPKWHYSEWSEVNKAQVEMADWHFMKTNSMTVKFLVHEKLWIRNATANCKMFRARRQSSSAKRVGNLSLLRTTTRIQKLQYTCMQWRRYRTIRRGITADNYEQTHYDNQKAHWAKGSTHSKR